MDNIEFWTKEDDDHARELVAQLEILSGGPHRKTLAEKHGGQRAAELYHVNRYCNSQLRAGRMEAAEWQRQLIGEGLAHLIDNRQNVDRIEIARFCYAIMRQETFIVPHDFANIDIKEALKGLDVLVRRVKEWDVMAARYE